LYTLYFVVQHAVQKIKAGGG